MSNPMLHNRDFVEVGFIRKAHGFSGAMKVVLEEDYSDHLNQVRFIFLEVAGCKIPYEVAELYTDRDTIMQLTFVDTRDDVLPFHQSPIFLLKEDLPSVSSDAEGRFQISQLAGMTVMVLEAGELGKIERIDEYPHQLMAVVRTNSGREVLIPLVDDFIVSIDEDEVTMDLPEGLI